MNACVNKKMNKFLRSKFPSTEQSEQKLLLDNEQCLNPKDVK